MISSGFASSTSGFASSTASRRKREAHAEAAAEGLAQVAPTEAFGAANPLSPRFLTEKKEAARP